MKVRRQKLSGLLFEITKETVMSDDSTSREEV